MHLPFATSIRSSDVTHRISTSWKTRTTFASCAASTSIPLREGRLAADSVWPGKAPNRLLRGEDHDHRRNESVRTRLGSIDDRYRDGHIERQLEFDIVEH